MRSFPFDVVKALALPVIVDITRGLQTIRFTTYETTLTVGGHDYHPAPGALISNISFPGDGSPSTLDLYLMTVSTGPVAPGDGVRGVLDGWPISVKTVDPLNLNLGPVDLMPGAVIGSVTEDSRGAAIIAVNGLLSKTKKQVIEHYALTGREDLGDNRCKIPIRPPDIQRGTMYDLPTSKAGLLDMNVAYGRVRDLSARTSPDADNVEEYQNVYFECTVAGVTAAGTIADPAPTYTFTPGDVIIDGTATFIARNSWLRYARGHATSDFVVQFDYSPDPRSDSPPDGTGKPWYELGGLFVCSGPLAGFPVMPIRWTNPPEMAVHTFIPFSMADMPAGTQFEIYPGCDLTREMCFMRFNNIINLRAETFVTPGNPLAPHGWLGAS